ncbi:spore germination protein GerW family protein [Kocuria arenosa]|uniref:spore germination protein GerW family protein n=1 Tax=Kocuria arenosa TaxID=3071446 RepID=UPI0034D67052
MSEQQPAVPSRPSDPFSERTTALWESGAPDRSVLERALDAVTVRRVFGEAYDLDGATIVPVAHVRGWGGGGGGSGEQHGDSGSGSGLGYGINASPAGVYVLHDGAVTWQPAVEPVRIALPVGLAFVAALGVVGWALATRRS